MYETFEELENGIQNCNKCKLCNNRTNIVLGVGNKDAKIMFIGEGPGADEDIQGIPFVGKAGKLTVKHEDKGTQDLRLVDSRSASVRVERGKEFAHRIKIHGSKFLP